MTRIKICGIRDVETARVAVESGADFIGLVLAASRRQISSETAQKISEEVHNLSAKILTVGVFVNQPATAVNNIATQCSLDYVQLSGDESWEYCKQIEKPIIKAIHVSNNMINHEIVTKIQKGNILQKGKRLLCLLDSNSPTSYGGTGKAFNWDLIKPIGDEYPVMIAGGLNAGNVPDLMRDINPWGVDVSSGVEISGIKKPGKIKEFIDMVRKLERKEN